MPASTATSATTSGSSTTNASKPTSSNQVQSASHADTMKAWLDNMPPLQNDASSYAGLSVSEDLDPKLMRLQKLRVMLRDHENESSEGSSGAVATRNHSAGSRQAIHECTEDDLRDEKDEVTALRDMLQRVL